MGCNLVYNLRNKNNEEWFPISIPIESETDSYLEILETLKNNRDKAEELFKYIEDNYTLNDPVIIKTNKEFFERNKGVVGNTTSHSLSQMYPTINFPENVNVDVLLIDRLVYGGKRISGRVINSRGNEVFVVRNETDDVWHLAKFLKIRKTLQDNPSLIDESCKYYNELNILKEQLKEKSISDMIIRFIENDTDYRTKYYTLEDGSIKSAFVLLDYISREIDGYTQKTEYFDQFVNTISKLQKYLEKDKDGRSRAKLDYKDLYYSIKAYNSDLLKKLNITSIDSFKDIMLSKYFDKSLFENIIENEPLIYTIFNELISKDKKYQYEISNLSKDGLILKWKFPTLKSKYGISYSEIKSFDIEEQDYKGYKIYSFNRDGKRIYLFSKTYLTEDSLSYKDFDAVDSIKKYIDERVLNEKLNSDSYYQFNLRSKSDSGVLDSTEYIYNITNSKTKLKPKTIFEVLNFHIDAGTKILDAEKKLITDKEKTLSDFHNYIRNLNISDETKTLLIEDLNNAEKAVLFIYKLNELYGFDRENESQILDVLNSINESVKQDRVSYFVNSKTNTSDYTLIPTNPTIIEEYKENQQIPIIQTLQAFKAILNNKFGVNINLLTASQISESIPSSLVDPNTAKAFILNGEIYINITIASGEDLLHEYSHIILGVLKSNPQLRSKYQELLENVWNRASNYDKKVITETYSKFSSKMDMREELFVKKFSEYLMKRRTSQEDEIFKQQEAYMKEGVKTIFDLSENDQLDSIYLSRIDYVFYRLSSDVATLIERGNGLDLDKIQESRRISKYITEQIKKEEIIESC